MNIQQFNMQFNAEEDRIIFRLNTIHKEEFRFFFTRRFVKLLYPILIKLLENEYKIREPEKAYIARDLADFEHEKVVSSANFHKEYVENSDRFPLGKEVLLLTGIKVKEGPQGNILCLFGAGGKGIEFQVDSRFLHIFCELLQNVVAKADWELEFMLGEKSANGINEMKNRVLH